jgi:hypothetical protein
MEVITVGSLGSQSIGHQEAMDAMDAMDARTSTDARVTMSNVVERAIRNARKAKKTVEFSDPTDGCSHKWVQVGDDFTINVSFPFDMDPLKKLSVSGSFAAKLQLICHKKGKNAMFSYDKNIHISALSSWVSTYFQDVLGVDESTDLKTDML